MNHPHRLARRAADALIRSYMTASTSALRAAGSLAQGRERDRGPAHGLAQITLSARNILVVALAEAGDMILISPFLRELRSGAPDARITLVVQPGSANLFQVCSAVDDLLVYDAHAPRVLRPLLLPPRAFAFARRHLRSRAYDLAIIPRWDTDEHLATAVALFSRARRRVGYSERVNSRKRSRNAGFDRLLTDVAHGGAGAHEVERNLGLLRFLGSQASDDVLQLWLSSADRARADAVVHRLREGASGPIVAFGIGASHPKRRWPVDRFIEVGRALTSEFGARVVIVGGPTDIKAQAAVVTGIGSQCEGLAGTLTFREAAAVLERCNLFVGNDSAPLHMAAAAGCACVEISCHPAGADPEHSNAPERFGPWRVRATVVRPPVHLEPCLDGCASTRPHCILGVLTADVLEACNALLQFATV